MKRKLENKVAVITGGRRGLGYAIGKAFVAEGTRVVLASRSAEALDEATARISDDNGQVFGHVCDVGDLRQVRALGVKAFNAFGKIDIWVNNAAVSGPYGPTGSISPEHFESAIRTNILGTYYGSMVAMSYLLPQNSGKIINILGAGSRRPEPMQNPYASSKAWVRSFTLALAHEYKDTGIGVFAFQPGLMETKFVQNVKVVEGYGTRLDVFKVVRRMWSKPPEVPADKTVWIASSATDGKTGIEYRQSGMGSMLWGALREGLRMLFKRTSHEVKLDIETIPPYQLDELQKNDL